MKTKPHKIAGGREAIGKQLQSISAELAALALATRYPLSKIADVRLRKLATSIQVAGQDLYDLATDVLTGAVHVEGEEPEGKQYPLFREEEDDVHALHDPSAAAGPTLALAGPEVGRPPGEARADHAGDGLPDREPR